MRRVFDDKSINTNGRRLLDFCKQNGLHICNGRIGEDKNVGKFTYIGSTGRSVIDYVISNPALFHVICKFRICKPNILSEHCTLEFSLCRNIDMYTTQRKEREPRERLDKNYAWDDTKKDQYIFNLMEQKMIF